MRTAPAAAILAASLAFPIFSVAHAAPDAVYLNARVYTPDPASTPAAADTITATAFAVEQGRFTALGSDDAVRRLALPTTTIHDLNGATVLPGLIDAHGHLAGMGDLLIGAVNLTGTKTYDEVIQRVAQRAAAAPPHTWIIGRGWDNESWPNTALPDHAPLTAAVPSHPVILARVDGHAVLVNQPALDAAGITAHTTPPPGGDILRRPDGSPTGVLVDNAEELVARLIPSTATPDTRSLLLAAQDHCLSLGLTSVHDMGVTPDAAALLQQLASDGTLKLRVHAAIAGPFALRYFNEHEPHRSPRLSIAAAKFYIDGALGSRGAWLLEPYEDRPTADDGSPYTGLAVNQPDFIQAAAEHALARRYQLFVHAIGDRGNRETLNAFEQAARTTGLPLADARFRVEHAQILSPDDIPRFAQLGVIASMQPTHATSDMRWVQDRIGKARVAGAYAWQSLLKAGATLAAGSDFPVESANPMLGLHAAATRQTADDQPPAGWRPEERLTRAQALRAFTLDAAFAAFAEADTGSITPGKRADFIILNTDIMTCPAPAIPTAHILATYIEGERVYHRAP